MNRDVIIACDFSSKQETLAFLDRFSEEKPYVKIGMELFYAAGPDIVREIKARGHKIFLDLKLHDIPNTVKTAMAVLSASGCRHVQPARRRHHRHDGGCAVEGLTRPDGTRPLLIAVTQLTSTSQERMEQRPHDPRAHRRGRHALCGKRQKGGAGRRRVLSPGGRQASRRSAGRTF